MGWGHKECPACWGPRFLGPDGKLHCADDEDLPESWEWDEENDCWKEG